jgi:hypothetical protein
VSVLGNLAGRIESQVEGVAGDEEVTGRLQSVIQRQTQLLGEQLQLLFDRMGVATDELGRSVERNDERVNYLGEHLQLMHDRIGMESRDLLEAIERADAHTRELLEARVRGLAELVRSDSEALRDELVRTAAEQDEAVAQRLEDGLGRVSGALSAAVRWLVEELTQRVHDETGALIQGRLQDAVATIDRNMVRMADTLETELDRLGRTVGEQAAVAAEDALSIKLDHKFAALAKMIRSDTQALGDRVQVAAEQDAAKQTLRAVKELQANLPAEVLEIVDQRMQEIAESVAKLGDLLERKVDQATAQMSERYDSDIQHVIDRMGDAMHALASLGKQKPNRIELE